MSDDRVHSTAILVGVVTAFLLLTVLRLPAKPRSLSRGARQVVALSSLTTSR